MGKEGSLHTSSYYENLKKRDDVEDVMILRVLYNVRIYFLAEQLLASQDKDCGIEVICRCA